MKYLKLFESFNEFEINKLCKKYDIRNYTINNDGSIDVDDGVYLGDYRLFELPIKFNKVNRIFICRDNMLETLNGCPKEVNGDFICNNNILTSFEFAPKIIRGQFDCRYNYIKSFEHFPSYVKQFYCIHNPIFEIWDLFRDTSKVELLNDFDIFRDEDKELPSIFIDRLNDFLEMIGKKTIKTLPGFSYKPI